jgi:hypothetical protein
MHGSAPHSPPVAPVSTSCSICGPNMRLAYVDPTGADTIYAYRCDAGHQHEILSADKQGESVVGLTFVKPVAGPAPAQIVREGSLPLLPTTQRDCPQFIWRVFCRPSRDEGGRGENVELSGSERPKKNQFSNHRRSNICATKINVTIHMDDLPILGFLGPWQSQLEARRHNLRGVVKG